MQHARHIAIAGSGLAGLATAVYLARRGHRVTLLERSQSLGGRAATTAHNGYRHNMGPHALYLGGEGEAVLSELGIAYTGRSPNVAGLAVRRGKTFQLPVGGRSLLTTRLLGMRARVEVGRHLIGLRNIAASDARTVRQWLDEEFTTPAGREYVEALVRLATYSNAPDTIGLVDTARQLAGTGSVLYIDGGWQSLVDGLAGAARAAGAEVRTSARVERVVFDAGTLSGLQLAGGETVAADAVVLALPPTVAAGLAGQSSAIANAAADAIPAHAACLDIGLRKLPNPRRTFALGIDAPMYYSVHSRYAALAPEGRAMLSVAKYLPPGEAHDADRDLAELEQYLDLVQPGWRELEEHRQYLPNMVVQSALPRADRGGISRRPAPVTDIDGVFVAGDWVGSSGWLTDGTLGSAKSAADAVDAWLARRPATALAGVS